MNTKKSNPNLIKIIAMLRDGGYHDGTTIGDKLRMTRAAVWKTIKKIQNYGIDIDSVKGKGYALKEPLVLLDANWIKRKLTKTGVDVVVVESTGSTNDFLKTAKQSKPPRLCLAEQQTNGKGRLQRTWHSPFAQNIYLSCLYSFHKDISELSGLSLITGLAVAKTLNLYSTKEKFTAKWPNDILYGIQKAAGSLIEIQAESHGTCEAIIGIGVNVNMLNDDKQVGQPWTSLRKVTGEYIDRNELSVILINNLLAYLQAFSDHGFSAFTREWEKADCLMNKSIALKQAKEKISGKVVGVNEQGHLLLRTESGKVQAFSSGDTSVLKAD